MRAVVAGESAGSLDSEQIFVSKISPSTPLHKTIDSVRITIYLLNMYKYVIVTLPSLLHLKLAFSHGAEMFCRICVEVLPPLVYMFTTRFITSNRSFYLPASNTTNVRGNS